jgi:hypothetical protein
MSEVEDILERSERMIKSAHAGLKQYQKSEGEEKIIGLQNAVTFGRSVTFVLQNLKGEAEGFEEWYHERVEVLKDDPVCSYMVELRNKILKEGEADTVSYTKIDEFNLAQLQAVTPSWADGSFIGDQYGGSGFYVERSDGTQEKFYVDFSFDNIETGLYFEETQEYEDQFPKDITEIEDDLEYYVKILAELVSDAKDEFGSEELNN